MCGGRARECGLVVHRVVVALEVCGGEAAQRLPVFSGAVRPRRGEAAIERAFSSSLSVRSCLRVATLAACRSHPARPVWRHIEPQMAACGLVLDPTWFYGHKWSLYDWNCGWDCVLTSKS